MPQNGSILDAFMLWKQNVDKRFDGIDDCCICYSAIHGSNYSLPDKVILTKDGGKEGLVLAGRAELKAESLWQCHHAI